VEVDTMFLSPNVLDKHYLVRFADIVEIFDYHCYKADIIIISLKCNFNLLLP
jgi:hypothetical protein